MDQKVPLKCLLLQVMSVKNKKKFLLLHGMSVEANKKVALSWLLLHVMSVETNKKVALNWLLLHVMSVESSIYNVIFNSKFSNKEIGQFKALNYNKV